MEAPERFDNFVLQVKTVCRGILKSVEERILTDEEVFAEGTPNDAAGLRVFAALTKIGQINIESKVTNRKMIVGNGYEPRRIFCIGSKGIGRIVGRGGGANCDIS